MTAIKYIQKSSFRIYMIFILFPQQGVFLMIYVKIPTQFCTVAVDVVVHIETIIVVHTLD